MSFSSLDFLSPKITLYYNGHNSHISQIGGLLSLFFLILLFVIIFNSLYQIVEPKIDSMFIYEQNSKDIKYNQTLDYSGISHFIQMYSHSNRGWFADFNNKNIIIYGVKENFINYDQYKTDLYKTEHWLYDKCENVVEINKKLFSEISEIISNYSKSICLRYYYNPIYQQYYEIGFQGYISPYLESNSVPEKRNVYKIIIEKCFNNSIFTDKMNYNCNNEDEIIQYILKYNDIFIHFSNNQINPKNRKYPFEKYYYSIASGVQKISQFENNLIFSPIKIVNDRDIFNSKKEFFTYILKDHYHNDKIIDEQDTRIGIFNLYFTNNIYIYQRAYKNILEYLSHIGGIAELLLFIFQTFNYINNRYIIFEHSKNLFKINAGIEANFSEGNEITFDKMRHLNSQNYKIKVFNNNNIINTDDYNKKIIKNATQNKKKMKYLNLNYENHLTPLVNRPSKKNLGVIGMPLNTLYHKKTNNYVKKRTQTKYSNTFGQMGKQFTLKNKRKSYMSQGYLMKRVDYSAYIKNPNFNDNNNNNNNDMNHEIISTNNNNINDNNNSNLLLLKDKDTKEGFFKHDSKNIGEVNIIRRNKKKKTNLKKHIENSEVVTQSNIKKIDPNIKGRHKSVNFGNQNFLFSANLLGIKNTFCAKNSSELVNDSSKQVPSNKNNFVNVPSKFQVEKNKFEDTISRKSMVNNNNNNNNNNDNLNNTIILNNNQNAETSSYLKNIIQSKIKLIMPEVKQDYTLNKIIEKKTNYWEFFKLICICFKKKDNKLDFLRNFRNKLLSEEHLYKVHINLYLLDKIFQIDEAYKLNFNELFNNL